MKLVRKFSFVKALLLSLGTLVLSTGMAHAQSLAGKFTLPTEVRWKTVQLPAGNYTFSVQGSGASSLLVVRSVDNRHAAMFLPASVTQTALTNSDSLQLIRQGEDMFVTSFEMGSIGLVFHYTTPAPGAVMASAPQSTMAGK